MDLYTERFWHTRKAAMNTTGKRSTLASTVNPLPPIRPEEAPKVTKAQNDPSFASPRPAQLAISRITNRQSKGCKPGRETLQHTTQKTRKGPSRRCISKVCWHNARESEREGKGAPHAGQRAPRTPGKQAKLTSPAQTKNSKKSVWFPPDCSTAKTERKIKRHARCRFTWLPHCPACTCTISLMVYVAGRGC